MPRCVHRSKKLLQRSKEPCKTEGVSNNPRGNPLPSDERDRLAAFVASVGEKPALDAIGCSKNALRSALAGMPVYGVTRAAIVAALPVAK
jgi:hypothetical protein